MDSWIKNGLNAIVAGLLASFVLSLIDIFNQNYHFAPGISPTLVLAKLLPDTLNPYFGLLHYLIGIMWAFLYIYLSGHLKKNIFIEGILFGFGIWLILMTTLMPYVNAGFFCINIGIQFSFFALMCDIIFGLTVAIVYEKNLLQWFMRRGV